MTHSNVQLQFVESGMIMNLVGRIKQMRKSFGKEEILTECGRVIDLNDVLSIDGVSWN